MLRFTKDQALKYAADAAGSWDVRNAPLVGDFTFIENVSGQQMVAKATLHMDSTVSVKIID
jgi:hypothetical protein